MPSFKTYLTYLEKHSSTSQVSVLNLLRWGLLTATFVVLSVLSAGTLILTCTSFTFNVHGSQTAEEFPATLHHIIPLFIITTVSFDPFCHPGSLQQDELISSIEDQMCGLMHFKFVCPPRWRLFGVKRHLVSFTLNLDIGVARH